MDLRKYQTAVMNGSLVVNDDDRFIESTLGLCGEAGEFADQVKKEMRDCQDRTAKQVDELGDVLWYLTSLAGQLGWSLEELASLNYQKLHERHPSTYPAVIG